MKIRLIAIGLFVGQRFRRTSVAQREHTPADTVIMHAKIYTVNQRLPWAEAVAIRDGKIVAVGSDESLAAYQSASTKVMEARDFGERESRWS